MLEVKDTGWEDFRKEIDKEYITNIREKRGTSGFN